jgi:anti-sigma factor RsiW
MPGQNAVKESLVTCREFSEFILDYLSDELPTAQKTAFERHLARCVNCDRYLHSYRESMILGKRAFDDGKAPLPSGVPDDLVRAILSARRQ